MSDLNVKILSYTADPERVVASAAKLCYSDNSAEDIYESLTDDKVSGFINMLRDLGHESPFEHVSFTFSIEGVSRTLLAQLTRHRIASYSVKSQRYVEENDFDYVIPPEISEIPEANAEFITAMIQSREHYARLSKILYEKHYDGFIKDGMAPEKASKAAGKRAIEDARFVLPNACETKLIMTMNARSLMEFFRQRCCNRAQWEIRRLAEIMLKEVKAICPDVFAKAGPQCVYGSCPEGKMTCGKAASVREHYRNLNNLERY